MSNTPEQQAIEQYLAKPLQGSYACGCVGEQPIECQQETQNRYELKIIGYDNSQRKNLILAIRQCTGLPLMEVKQYLDNQIVFGFEEIFYGQKLKNQLEAIGVKCEVTNYQQLLYPYCPCAMINVIEVEKNFYKVIENRSEKGVTHKAYLLGPVGGPYNILDE